MAKIQRRDSTSDVEAIEEYKILKEDVYRTALLPRHPTSPSQTFWGETIYDAYMQCMLTSAFWTFPTDPWPSQLQRAREYVDDILRARQEDLK